MFCEKCGTRLPYEARFCANCGVEIKKITASYNSQDESIEIKGDVKVDGETVEINASNAEVKNEELYISEEDDLTGQTLKVTLNHSHMGSMKFYADKMIFTPNSVLENIMAISSFDIFGSGKQKELEVPYSVITDVEIGMSFYSFYKAILVRYQEGTFYYNDSPFSDNHFEIFTGFSKKAERDKILKYLLLKIGKEK